MAERAEIKKYNPEIDLLKFCFAIMIVYVHLASQMGYPYFLNGNFGVEFFFMVSGFYLAKQVREKEGDTTDRCLTYVKRRITGIYPFLLVGLVMGIAEHLIYAGTQDIGTYLTYSLSELLLIQIYGYPTSGAVGVLWFSSAMMAAIVILYPCIKYGKRYFVRLLSLLIGLLLYGYMFQATNTVSYPMTFLGPVSKGLMRAVGSMCFGVFAYGLISETREETFKRKRILLRIGNILAYLVVFLVMTFAADDSPYVFFLIPVLLFAVCTSLSGWLPFFKASWFTKLCRYLGTLSLPIYMIQYPIVRILSHHIASLRMKVNYIILFLAVFAVSAAVDAVIRLIRKGAVKKVPLTRAR